MYESSSLKKKNVKFDSSIYLDEIFKKAYKLSYNSQETMLIKKYIYDPNKNLKLSIGIDIVCYGAYNSKLAYVLINQNGTINKIDMFYNHIGNLRIKEKNSKDDIEFIDQFQLLINKIFHLFGKRWYELTEYDIKLTKLANFKIIQHEQYPHICFNDDKERLYKINDILKKFFKTIFLCIGIDLDLDTELINTKFTKLCLTLPSDFHSYQRLCLKNCFEQIGLINNNNSSFKFLMVNKSTSLALPFMSKNLSDMSKKFIIDFGSGYMNCSILERTSEKQINVIDQLADRCISSKKFYEDCYQFLKQEVKKNFNLSLNKTQSRYDLYCQMNKDHNLNKNIIKENWLIKTHNIELNINMKRLGIEQLANSVIDKLKKTCIIDKNNMKLVPLIKDILICSDSILYEYLEPLLKHYCCNKTNIIFIDNDCACLGAALLASESLNLTTFDMLPYSIGVGLYNGVVKTIIENKKNFPCNGKHLLQTLVDNQTTLRINLYEGESPLARNCKHICEFVMNNLRKDKAGKIKIEVEINIDQNGILHAFAKDIDLNEVLAIEINCDSFNCFESKKLKYAGNNKINIDDRLTDSKHVLKNDSDLAKKLQDFDYYFEYLVNLYKASPMNIQYLISKKIYLAKKYISKNRLLISVDDLNQLRSELEILLNNYRPFNLDHETNNKKTNRSSLCNLL